MERNLSRMSGKEYDLIIIGGGITGAAMAWDASLRGLSCALLEKSDFASRTSAGTSKLIHGGLRYLKNFEIGLVRESLSERRIMEVITPQFVYPIPFIIPIYGYGIEGRLSMQAALTVYDLLAYDKESIEDVDKRVPNHRMLKPREVKKLLPGIEKEGLSGGALYYDCQMHTPERHVLEFILSASEYGGDMVNYSEVVDIIMDGNLISGVKVKDRIDNKDYEIKGKVIVNVTGPWGDITLSMLHKKGVERKLLRSKGIHIITRELAKDYGVVLKTEEGRHFFIIPWRGHSLIGTTDRLYDGDPDDFKVSEKDIEGLVTDTNKNFPGANLTRDDVLYFYGGLRPIVDKETDQDVYDASRKYEIYDHEVDDDIKGIITVIGGKYTTSRNLAMQVVDMVYEKLGEKSPECQTDSTPLYGGSTGPFKRYIEKENRKHKKEYPKDVIKNLIYQYGTEHGRVMALGNEDESLKERIIPGRPHIMAQVAYAVKSEMAFNLDDVVFRRTGLGTLGNPGRDVLTRCAGLMGKLLGWSEKKMGEEIGWVEDYYVPITSDGEIPSRKGAKG